MKILVEKVKEQGKRVSLTFRIFAPMGERHLRGEVPFITYAGLGSPEAGEEVSEETFRGLVGEREDKACRDRACYILGYAPNSRRKLEEKLRLRGFTDEAIDSAVGQLLKLGYLDEEGQVERLLELAKKKFYPRQRALRALVVKGYPRSTVLGMMEQTDYNDGEIKEALLSAKFFPEEEENPEEAKRKLLYKYGFR